MLPLFKFGLQIARFPLVPTLQTPVSAHDFHQGKLDAPIQLVHFGDFECPYSGALYGALKQLQAEEGEKLLYVFRPFPLADVHPHALSAARAAYAANEQGKFWPMYNTLFPNQDALEPSDLESYAQNLGLDAERFERDFRSGKYDSHIQNSIQDGHASGAHGTPTVFLNGQFHDNSEGLWKLSRLHAAVRAL